MLKRILSILPLLLAAFISPAQVVEVPTIREVDRKLDSLAAVLRAEFKDVQPGLPECEHPLELVSVYNVSVTGLEYNFYSVGVKNLTSRVYTPSGSAVFSYTSKDVKKDRIQIFFNLPPGDYLLQLENADCKAVSKKVPFIVPGGDREEPTIPTVPGTGFNNNGARSLRSGGLLYEWIQSENVSVSVSNGRVRINAPETKTTFDGSAKAYRFLLVEPYDQRPTGDDERALFAEGLALPPGQYTFKILYLATTRWPIKLWDYVGYQDGDRHGFSKSGQTEHLTISVTSEGMDQYRVSWFMQYPIIDTGLSLPEDKIFGVTRYFGNYPHSSIFRNATHVQNPGGVFNYKGPDFYWFNIQARPGTRMPDQVARETPITRRFVAMAELTENYGNDLGCADGSCSKLSEQAFKLLYEKAKRELGVTSPNQTWSISDYFAPLYGGSISVPEFASYEWKKDGLSSIKNARSRYETVNDVPRWSDCFYFSAGAYDYRNYLVNGYLGNILQQAGKQTFYERLYNLEKAGLAIPDRKRISYVTNAQEALHMDAVTDGGVWYSLPFPGGDLLRVDGLIHGFETMRNEAFYSLLYGNGLLIWESNTPMNDDPGTFDRSWFGGQDDWKTKWLPTGGTASTYQPGKNGSPPMKDRSKGQFPEKPLVGDQGAYVGAKDFESIKDRVAELWYPDFSIDGRQVVSVRGKLGQKLSVNGVQNEGQTQIVELEKARLPVVIKGRGPGGDVLIYHNPNAGLVQEQGVEVDGRFFKIKGNKLNIIKL